ncbi:MAG: matrixin family metalloprotease [Actinobacteria bacterium]|nr:matrixin family metalloprotease [Actinomycetota bacterium]
MVAAAAFAQVGSLGREALDRLLALPELALSLAGRRTPKKLRLRIVVLRDEDGRTVAGASDVAGAIADARAVFAEEAAVEIVALDGKLVTTAEGRAPAEALDAPCSDSGLWRADLGAAGSYFRPRAARGSGFGRGAPITVFVVRDVVGKCGCSLGPLGDYITIDPRGLELRRILAHELAHSCGLAHRAAKENLMRPHAPGQRLTAWQRAVVRSSRHVTYL